MKLLRTELILWESQRQSGIGATICQTQGGPGPTPAGVKILMKKMTTNYSFCQPSTWHSLCALKKQSIGRTYNKNAQELRNER